MRPSFSGHPDLKAALENDLDYFVFVGPGVVFRPGEARSHECRAPRVLALCGVNSPAHQEDVKIKAQVRGGSYRSPVEVTVEGSSCITVDQLLVRLARQLQASPWELSIQAPCGATGSGGL